MDSDRRMTFRERMDFRLMGLRPYQWRRLEQLKISTHLSLSAMIREAVDQWLRERAPR